VRALQDLIHDYAQYHCAGGEQCRFHDAAQRELAHVAQERAEMVSDKERALIAEIELMRMTYRSMTQAFAVANDRIIQGEKSWHEMDRAHVEDRRRLEQERAEDRAAIRAAIRIMRESAPNSFAGAWLPDYEKAHAAAIARANKGTP
jgi:sigma54-dependent transcription regulator